MYAPARTRIERTVPSNDDALVLALAIKFDVQVTPVRGLAVIEPKYEVVVTAVPFLYMRHDVPSNEMVQRFKV